MIQNRVRLIGCLMIGLFLFCACSGRTGQNAGDRIAGSESESKKEKGGLSEEITSDENRGLQEDGGYLDYYSQERRWEDLTLAYAESEGYDGYMYFVNGDTRDGSGDGRIYKALEQDEDGNGISWEKMMENKIKVLADYVGPERFARIYDRLIFVSEKGLLMESDLDGKERRLLFECDEPINALFANDQMVYFLAGRTFYRCYRPSGKTDTLFTAQQQVEVWTPISNHMLSYTVLTEEGAAMRAAGMEPISEDAYGIVIPLVETYLFSAQKMEQRPVKQSDFDENDNLVYPINW